MQKMLIDCCLPTKYLKQATNQHAVVTYIQVISMHEHAGPEPVLRQLIESVLRKAECYFIFGEIF